jgi:hypothetical protein
MPKSLNLCLWFLQRAARVQSQKFVQKVQPMLTAGSELKSPFVPLFQRGNFLRGLQTLFGKEGKGRFFAEEGTNYVANFWVTTLAQETRVR